MPTCTPEAVLAAGAAFQQTDARGIQLCRVALLWNQNGSSGTAATIYASGAPFDACDAGQLAFIRTTLLWLCAFSSGPPTVPQMLISAASYQDAAPAQRDMCETISEWIEQGSSGSVSSVLVVAEKFQGLSRKQLTIVEIMLLQSIHAFLLTPAQLLTDAQAHGFVSCDSAQLSILSAYLYCQLS